MMRRSQAWAGLLVSGPGMCMTPLSPRADNKHEWLEPGTQSADGRRGGQRADRSHFVGPCMEFGVYSEGGGLECGNEML